LINNIGGTRAFHMAHRTTGTPWRGKQRRYGERGKDRVPVRVNQSRHHDPSAAIDYPRATRWGRIVSTDLRNTISLDEDTKPSPQFVRFSGEEQNIPKHERPRGAFRSRLCELRTKEPKRCERGAHPREETASRQLSIDSRSGELDLRLTAGAGRGGGELNPMRGHA